MQDRQCESVLGLGTLPVRLTIVNCCPNRYGAARFRGALPGGVVRLERLIFFQRLTVGSLGPIDISQASVDVPQPAAGAGRLHAEAEFRPFRGSELVVDGAEIFQKGCRFRRDDGLAFCRRIDRSDGRRDREGSRLANLFRHEVPKDVFERFKRRRERFLGALPFGRLAG